MSTASNVNRGIKPIGLLWVALIVLKIIGYLTNISWWLIIPFPVLAYISIWIVVGLTILGIAVVMGIIGATLFFLSLVVKYFSKSSRK